MALTFFFYQRLGDWYALYHPEQGKIEKHDIIQDIIQEITRYNPYVV